mmetsp:Transcript_16383/g.34277  ORF Transcript_16383/g.34277 Transcript_16383/m.34277 type:complete len:378 (+) Transcript_16383:10-1143(+)
MSPRPPQFIDKKAKTSCHSNAWLLAAPPTSIILIVAHINHNRRSTCRLFCEIKNAMSSTPPNNFFSPPPIGAPPTKRQAQHEQPAAQYVSSIPTSFSNFSSTNANSTVVNASTNPTGPAPATVSVKAVAPSASRSMTTAAPVSARTPITMAGHITIVGGKVTSGATSSSNTNQSESKDHVIAKKYKISIPPPHPAGRYANETLAILGSAYSEKRTSKSREECIKTLEKSVPTMAFLRSLCSKTFEGEQRGNLSGGRKRKSLDDDCQNKPECSDSIESDSNTAKISKEEILPRIKESTEFYSDDSESSGHLQDYSKYLKQELAHQKLQNQLLMQRRKKVFQSMVKLHELYESGLDGIARMGDLRNVPDNVMSNKIHLF